MFQRRKILLTLLDACGGEMTRTDMQKLLFCYCAETGRNYYDFFPHRFGCYSFLASQDKHVLTIQGYLSKSEEFKLKKSFKMTDNSELAAIRRFAAGMRHLRGKKLIRHVYLKYPYYATRSEIKESLLRADELAIIEGQRNKNKKTTLFTIGYEGLTIDGYINKLIQNNIACVIDVRRNPISMKYGFSKTRFSHYLQSVGIHYKHIPELGIESSLRRGLESEADYARLFKNYVRESLPKRESELRRIQEFVSMHRRVALTCFESSAVSCHRHKITEHLESSKNWRTKVQHIS